MMARPAHTDTCSFRMDRQYLVAQMSGLFHPEDEALRSRERSYAPNGSNRAWKKRRYFGS